MDVVAIDSRDRVYVRSRDRERVLVFAEDGRFLREIGRTGRGPGEIDRVMALIIGVGDSLVVVDAARRLSVIDPESFTVKRTVQLPSHAARMVLTPQGIVVVQSSIPNAAAAGYPVHTIEVDGRVAKSFGMDADVTFSATCTYCSRRDLGTSRDPLRVWLSRANRYEFEQWSVEGKRIARYAVINSRWFRSWTTETLWRHGTERRQPTLLGVHEPEMNIICAIGSVSARRWRQITPPPGSRIELHPAGGMMGPIPALEEYYFDVLEQTTESVIDCFDLERRRLIATLRVPGNLRLLDGSKAAKVVKLEGGLYGVTVYDVTVVR